MTKISVTDEYLQSILTNGNCENEVKVAPPAKTEAPIKESTEVAPTEDEITPEMIQEALDNGTIHQCPLCESLLEEAIPDEKIQEHVNRILDVLNEANEVDGEDLTESDEDK